MNPRPSWRRLLLTAAAAMAVCVGPILYCFTVAKGSPCRKELIVQFGKLSDGEYEFGIAVDDYVNHCMLQVAHGFGRSATCDQVQDVLFLVSAAKFYFPTLSTRIKIDLRRDGDVILARAFTPAIANGHNGCAAATVFVPDLNSGRDLGEKNQ